MELLMRIKSNTHAIIKIWMKACFEKLMASDKAARHANSVAKTSQGNSQSAAKPRRERSHKANS